MRRLLGVVIALVLIFVAYQWVQQLNEESKPAIIGKITDSIKRVVQLGGEKLKEELDSIEQRVTTEAEHSNSLATIAEVDAPAWTNVGEKNSNARSDRYSEVIETELSTNDEQQIIEFLADQFEERKTSFTFYIKGSHHKISDQMPEWLKQALELNEYARYAMASYSYTISNKLLNNEVQFKAEFREGKEMTDHVRSHVKKQLQAMNLSQYTNVF